MTLQVGNLAFDVTEQVCSCTLVRACRQHKAELSCMQDLRSLFSSAGAVRSVKV